MQGSGVVGSHCFQQNAMQVGAMHLQRSDTVSLRDLIGADLVEDLAGGVVASGPQRHATRGGLELGIDPEVTQGTARIGGHDEAGTELAKLRRALVHCDLEAAPLQGQACRQAADAATDDDDLTDFHGHRSECLGGH